MTKKSPDEQREKDAPPQPDPETLHTTDPQEHMKGPISSLMQKIKEEAQDDDKKTREDIEEERLRDGDPYKPHKV